MLHDLCINHSKGHSIDRRRERRSAPSRLAPRNREAASGRAQDMQQHRDLRAVYHRNASTATPKPQIVSDKRGVCSTPHTLNCFNPNAKDAPIRIGASFQRGFASGIARAEHLVGMHSESPGSNTLSACFRVCRIRTQCQHAFGITRAERHVGMHSHLPEPDGTPASQARPPSP